MHQDQNFIQRYHASEETFESSVQSFKGKLSGSQRLLRTRRKTNVMGREDGVEGNETSDCKEEENRE